MTYEVPPTAAPTHLVLALITGAAGTGVIAVGLVLATTLLAWVSAPATFTAICAAFLGVAAFVVHSSNRQLEYQRTLYIANRDASNREIKRALGAVHKEFTAMQVQKKTADAERFTAAVADYENAPHLRSVDGPRGLG